MADADTPKIIRPPSQLKDKVDKGGPGSVDLDAIARAEEVIANLAGDYVSWAKDDLVRMDKAYAELKAGGGDDKKQLNAIFEIAHDMKGQGGSFGYQLMTQIGNQLCRLVETMDSATPKKVEIIKLYIDAMRVVINEGLTGDGGKAGNTLLTGLEAMIAKFKE